MAVKLGLWAFLLLLIVGGGYYILFFRNLFDLHSIAISSPDNIDSDEIRVAAEAWMDANRLPRVARRNNILIFSPQRMSDSLRDQFPAIADLDISRTSRHSFSIKITSRKPAGIWCLTKSEQCYYFDQSGIAYAEIPQTSGALYLLIKDERMHETALGEKITDSDWLKAILLVRNSLQFSNIGIRALGIEADSFNEFYVETTQGWKIMFSLETSLSDQTSALSQFLKEKISSDELLTLEYIDLRIPNRIYYKIAEAESVTN